MVEEIRVDGRVVTLVSDDELVINLGAEDGVEEGDVYEVLDARTMSLTDPSSGNDLGSIKRVLTMIRVTEVGEQASIAKVYPSRPTSLGEISNLLSGSSRPKRTLSEGWREGVKRGDPIMRSKAKVARDPGAP